ncbi:MAG: Leupeptin-inactivating enzyme 2 [Labilithrix sp.]|nr:Leupeptin-inactivating enzyme 2 [Labilithrix sp.]
MAPMRRRRWWARFGGLGLTFALAASLVSACQSSEPPRDARLDELTEEHERTLDASLGAMTPDQRREELEKLAAVGESRHLQITRSARGTVQGLWAWGLAIPVAGARAPGDAARTFLQRETSLFDLSRATLEVQPGSSASSIKVGQRHGSLPVWNAQAVVQVGPDMTIRGLWNHLVPQSMLAELPLAPGDRKAAERAALAAVGPEAAIESGLAGVWVTRGVESGEMAADVAWRFQVSMGDRDFDVAVGRGEKILVAREATQRARHHEVYRSAGATTLQFDDACHADCAYSSPNDFKCATCPAGWCVAGHCANPAVPSVGATDALKTSVDTTYAYLSNTFGRDGWKGNGTALTVIGFGPPATYIDGYWVNNDEELWISQEGGKCLDMVAHEYGHALNQGSNGPYGDNSPLGEGWADVFSQFVEHYQYGTTDWVWAGVNAACPAWVGNGLPRSLKDPESTGDPSNYAYDQFYDHSAYAIYGKAAYLFSRATNQRPATVGGVSTFGIGVAAAQQLWWDASFNCSPQNATVNQFRTCLAQKACAFGQPAANCKSAYAAMDAVGLFRASKSIGTNVAGRVATANVSGPASDDTHFVFFQDSADGGYVSYRKRTCPKLGPCTAAWSAALGMGTYIDPVGPSAVAVGAYVYVAGSSSGKPYVYKFDPVTGTIVSTYAYGTWYQTDAPVSLVEYAGDLYLFYRVPGAGAQAVKGYRINPTNGSIIATLTTPALSTNPATAASGTMDGVSPSAASGLWLVYTIDHNELAANGTPIVVSRIAYRSYDPQAATWSAELLAGENVYDGAINPKTTSTPSAAIWRGKMYLAGRTAAGDISYGFCTLPCANAASWTGWPKIEPSANDAMILNGAGPQLQLWHRSAGASSLFMREKFGD